MVLTVTLTILTAGLRTGDECFTVNRSLPAKVQVWIPATDKENISTLECWELVLDKSEETMKGRDEATILRLKGIHASTSSEHNRMT